MESRQIVGHLTRPKVCAVETEFFRIAEKWEYDLEMTFGGRNGEVQVEGWPMLGEDACYERTVAPEDNRRKRDERGE